MVRERGSRARRLTILAQRGIEPDKSYWLNNRKNIPDLAIEVVLTSGGIDSLEIYQALGVPEVWFWQHNQLRVCQLKEKNYERVEQSQLLPELDLAVLASYIAWEEPFDAVLAFRKQIRSCWDDGTITKLQCNLSFPNRKNLLSGQA